MEYIGDINYDEALESDQLFIIYGAGYFGKKVLGFCREKNKEKNIICFCDRNKQLWGKRIENIKVMGIAKAIEKYPQAHFIVVGVYAKEMIEELQSLNINRIHLLFM